MTHRPITREEALAIPATYERPVVVMGTARSEVFVRHHDAPGATWYEPGSEFGWSGLLPASEGPFTLLYPTEGDR